MHDIFILFDGLGNSCAPFNCLAAEHLQGTGWDEDLRALGPWSPANPPGGTAFPEGARQSTAPAISPGPVFVCDQATSAFDVAWELQRRDHFQDWSSVLAISQTRGRGQLRRPWSSPPGNLHAVVRWPEPRDFGPLVTLMAGLALVRALEQALERALNRSPTNAQETGLHASLSLKWPNDVLLDGHKVAGVLAEERGGVLCVGMGLNLRHAPPKSTLRDDWAVPAGTLPPLHGPNTDAVAGPLAVWTDLAARLRNEHEQLYALSSEDIVATVSGRLAGAGTAVRLHEAGQEPVHGRLVGLAPDGGLKLETPEGTHIFHSGSMTFIARP